MRKLYYFDSKALADDFTNLCKMYRLSASSVIQRLCYLYITNDSLLQQRVVDVTTAKSMAINYKPDTLEDFSFPDTE